MIPPIGKVALVGAGPGDPELLTLRGRRLLALADVVFYDYLVDPRVLKHCRPETRRVCLGRHGTGRLVAQDEIHRLLTDEATAGRFVVHLKGGDACVFGRLAEEISALEDAGIAYEVVPGVTAAAAASAATGIPLTHRDCASCVAFITGQQASASIDAELDFSNLAKFPGTLAFYMGVTTASSWSHALLAHGKPATTPVAIVRYASLPRQQTLITTLGQVEAVLAAGKTRPPAVILVGESINARAKHDWFSCRPLFGQTILVTRPVHQADALGDALAELGACVLSQPAIEIGVPADWGPLDAALDRLRETDWAVFSSANGVHAVCERLAERGLDLRVLGGVRLAAIGPATSQALAARGLLSDLAPERFRAEDLAAALADKARGKRCLLIRASRGRETLAEMLRASGAQVDQAVAYESLDVETPDPEIATALAAGQIDWITVTSSAIARSLGRMFGSQLSKARLAAISPLTAATLVDLGQTASAVASSYEASGLVAAIVQSVTNTSTSETSRGNE